MLHPPGPSRLYPEANQALEDLLAEMEMEEYQKLEEEMVSEAASGSPETTGVIEPPPEWGRPDEGTPNQPRRPPEYNPPQVCIFYTVLMSDEVSFSANCVLGAPTLVMLQRHALAGRNDRHVHVDVVHPS